MSVDDLATDELVEKIRTNIDKLRKYQSLKNADWFDQSMFDNIKHEASPPSELETIAYNLSTLVPEFIQKSRFNE